VPRRMAVDRWLFFTAGLLVVAGIIMVGSASHYVAMSEGLHPYHYLLRHILHLAIGVGCLAATLSIPYRRWSDKRLVVALVVASLAALTVVLAMPAAGGAHRWFRIGPLNLQPSEFAKLATILFMACLLSRRENEVNDLWAVPIPCLGAVGMLALLIAVEPDLGSALMLAGTAFMMLFAAGLRWRYIGAAGALGLAGLGIALVAEPYRLERIRSYLDPASDTLGSGFQLTQSLIAVGSGGITGVGLGQSQQKAYYLPAPHTDFIFSVIGEEFGLIGTAVILAAFLLLLWRGLRAARRAPDRFGFYLALGLTSLLVWQGLVHMGVCIGLLPTKGLPLPFVSYGGSSLLATMLAMGLLLNVSQHSN
jgi:cell division protein FtsW